MGTLTTEINGLVKKGYVIRNRSDKDRRIVYASLTPKGLTAFEHHKNFHTAMVNSIVKDLNEEEAAVLTKTFNRLEDFFGQWTD
jgi:DNA-binding MarR family transcriptional regulator